MDGQAGGVQSIDLGGPVHYVDFAGPGERATIVLVHGLGGSHLNWELFPRCSPPEPGCWRWIFPGSD